MFSMFIFFCLWHLVDGVKRVYVMGGDSVTLKPEVHDTDRNMHHIVWGFGPEFTSIAEWFTEVTYHFEQKFGGRLQMDSQTGSLTISNIRTTDAGLYQISIYYYNPFMHKTVLFNVTVYDQVETVLLTEGDSVTLHTNVPDIHRQDIPHMQWRIEPESNLIDITFDKGTPDIIYHYDKTFRDTLQMDNQTGSLTIMNIRSTDSGLYALQFFRLQSFAVLFNITVFALLPIPVIIRGSSQCPSSSSSSGSSQQNCSLLCSVVNVSDATLSWYKGNSLLSSISVSDLSISLSLEVEYQDNNTYSCSVNNRISNQTTHLDIITPCQPCPDSVHCCGFTEAVIRLVLSAVVGVATVATVMYDIRSRRAGQKWRTSQSFAE